MSKRTTSHNLNERYKIVTAVLEEIHFVNDLLKTEGINKSTLRSWIRKYNADGIEGIQKI